MGKRRREPKRILENTYNADVDVQIARKVAAECHNSNNLDAIAKKFFYDNVVIPRVIRNSCTDQNTLLFLLETTLHKTHETVILQCLAENCGRFKSSEKMQKLFVEMILKSTPEIRLAIARNVEDTELLTILIKYKPVDVVSKEEASRRLQAIVAENKLNKAVFI